MTRPKLAPGFGVEALRLVPFAAQLGALLLLRAFVPDVPEWFTLGAAALFAVDAAFPTLKALGDP